MAWIESHQSLSRHRKTLAAVAILRIDRHKFLGHLHELWWWALDNADVDGLLGHVVPETLAEAAGWPVKSAEKIVNALIDVGFLEVSSAGVVIHDWYDFAGKFNDERELRKASNRDAQRRRRHRLRADGQHDIADTSAENQRDIADSQQPTVPNLTVPNLPNPTGVTPPAPTGLSAARAPAREPLTRDQRAELVEKWTEPFGGNPAEVEAEIDRALNHNGRLKRTSERVYVDSWLHREISDYRPSRGRKNGPTPTVFSDECTCELRRDWLKTNRNSNPVCDLHGDVRDQQRPAES